MQLNSRSIRPFLVLNQDNGERLEVLAYSRTQALVQGQELLDAPLLSIRALELHDF